MVGSTIFPVALRTGTANLIDLVVCQTSHGLAASQICHNMPWLFKIV